MGLCVIRRSAYGALAALLMGVGTLVAVAPAHADKADEFIERLDLDGVPYENQTEVIRAAKEFCLQSSRPNANRWRVADKMAEDMGWSPTEAQEFGIAARRVYCPNI